MAQGSTEKDALPPLFPVRMGKDGDELISIAHLPCQAQSSININPNINSRPILEMRKLRLSLGNLPTSLSSPWNRDPTQTLWL